MPILSFISIDHMFRKPVTDKYFSQIQIHECTHILEHAVCLKSSLFWLNLRMFNYLFYTVYIKTPFALNEESC
jgi:hypothetical protein